MDIRHPNGIKTRYAHLKTVKVPRGQRLGAGDTIGFVGRAGRTPGANLHFEVRKEKTLVNPCDVVSNFERIVAG